MIKIKGLKSVDKVKLILFYNGLSKYKAGDEGESNRGMSCG